MFRPSKELITDSGIRYLEYYGMRIIRIYLGTKIGMTVIGCIFSTIAIVTSSLQVVDEAFYYIWGGMGGFCFLLAIIFIFVFPNRRFFNNVTELRDQNAVMELKEILYKPDPKSTIALLALIDLGEVEPETFHRKNQYSYQ